MFGKSNCKGHKGFFASLRMTITQREQERRVWQKQLQRTQGFFASLRMTIIQREQ
jgi:hypothetical protein